MDARVCQNVFFSFYERFYLSHQKHCLRKNVSMHYAAGADRVFRIPEIKTRHECPVLKTLSQDRLQEPGYAEKSVLTMLK